jgi:chromosome segregation ATPase
MKKIVLLLACVGIIALTACNRNANKLKDAQAQNSELNDSLQTANAEKDSLMSLVTDINNGMMQIRDMEQLMSSTNLNTESADKKQQIKDNMVVIEQALQDRRQKLEQLEARLKKSSAYSDKMKSTIESLKKQLAEQESTIADLQAQLKAAHIQIAGLNTRVDSLNTVNANVNREKKAAQDESVRIANELNVCYYAIGSKSELKKNNIIQTGFLRKTKIMESDYEKSYFTKADKRTLSEINLHAKKAKVLSKHPAGSYQIVDNGGSKVLQITNATKFWELSNFLIVQIN